MHGNMEHGAHSHQTHEAGVSISLDVFGHISHLIYEI